MNAKDKQAKIIQMVGTVLDATIRERAVQMVDEDWADLSSLLLEKGKAFKEKVNNTFPNSDTRSISCFPFTAPALWYIGGLREYVGTGKEPPDADKPTEPLARAAVTYGDWYLQQATEEILYGMGIPRPPEKEDHEDA